MAAPYHGNGRGGVEIGEKKKKTNTTQKNYFFLFFPSADENVHKPNAPWKKRQKSD